MSPELSHQQIEELLGAYAVDAVDADEAEIIDLHLRTCPRCRAEVAEHREVAALLAHTGAQAPDGVWTRILAEIDPAPPALRMPELPDPAATAHEPQPDAAAPEASVVDLAARRATARTRILVVAVAAAAVVVALVGVVTVRQNQHLNRLDVSLRAMSLDRIATQAMSDPKASSGKLTSPNGRIKAPVVLDARGRGYLFATDLPALPANRTYQLWGQAGGATVSLGVFDGSTDVVPFQVDRQLQQDLSRLMVTSEKSPGVLVTKQQPLLIGAI